MSIYPSLGQEKESPEYFARLAKDPKTRLRGTRTTSRRVNPGEGQPEFPASATGSVRRPGAGRRIKDDPTIDLTTVNAKAAADRRRAIDKEKAEKTEKMNRTPVKTFQSPFFSFSYGLLVVWKQI